MKSYGDDDALQEIHDEMYRAEQERPKKGFSTMDQKTRFWISVAAGAVLIMYFFGKMSLQQAAVIGGAVIAIVMMSSSDTAQRKELTMIECMMRINDLLKFLQEHPIGDYPQIPRGELRVKPIGKKQWFQGQAFKRSFAVDIYDEEKDVTNMYFSEVDVYTGDIITFREAPEGVTGDEKKDIVLLPTPDMLMQKKRDEYIGKTLYGK